MTSENKSERARFYRERDCRTLDYLGGDSPCLIPVSVHAGNDACLTLSGQLLLVTLANQLARVHQQVLFSLATPDAALLTRLCVTDPVLAMRYRNCWNELIRMAHLTS